MFTKKSQWLWAIPLVALTLLFALQGHVVADGQAIWQDVTEARIASRGTREIVPQSYRVVAANVNALETALAAAPLEFSAEANSASQTVALPLPDGTFEQFNVLYAPIMAPELAAEYPQIRTYRVTGIDNPASAGRIDLTPQGFHGFVISPAGTFFIDPFQTRDMEHYISYYHADFRTDKTFTEVNFQAPTIERTASESRANRSTGPTRWTYDLLMMASGEFVDYHCSIGTCANDAQRRAVGQAALVTGMNRVSAIYELDMSVSFRFVANNDQFVFTNAATDIFTDCCKSDKMIAAMQAHLNSGAAPAIAVTAYDIGHAVGAGDNIDGGLAGPAPCEGTHGSGEQWGQANGATGSDEPINDPFWVTLTAHEIGHQFFAGHSYNTNTEPGCTTRQAESAYEPASGSTIMSYASICGVQDLQPNPDAMFNAGALEQMVNFLDNNNAGDGAPNNCATTTATGNTAPVPNAGADLTIPKDTPFALAGTATDAEQSADALTYSWEQYNLGAAWTAPNVVPNTDQADNQTRPILRVYAPAASPVRTFPALVNVLDGTNQNNGEDLPTIAQAMTFRLTVRDGQGGMASDDMVLTIDPNQGPFLVTSDNTRATWNYPGTETITWSVNNTAASCPNVNILISTNDGQSFLATPLVANTPNDGSEVITVPDYNSSQIRVKVACANNIFFDINNAAITISGATAVGLQSNDVSTATSSMFVLALTSLLVLGSAATITVKRRS